MELCFCLEQLEFALMLSMDSHDFLSVWNDANVSFNLYQRAIQGPLHTSP